MRWCSVLSVIKHCFKLMHWETLGQCSLCHKSGSLISYCHTLFEHLVHCFHCVKVYFNTLTSLLSSCHSLFEHHVSLLLSCQFMSTSWFTAFILTHLLVYARIFMCAWLIQLIYSNEYNRCLIPLIYHNACTIDVWYHWYIVMSVQ